MRDLGARRLTGCPAKASRHATKPLPAVRSHLKAILSKAEARGD